MAPSTEPPEPIAVSAVCDHHYETRLRGGDPLTVRICTLCRTPDWDDLADQAADLYRKGREAAEAAEAAAKEAIRDRIVAELHRRNTRYDSGQVLEHARGNIAGELLGLQVALGIVLGYPATGTDGLKAAREFYSEWRSSVPGGCGRWGRRMPHDAHTLMFQGRPVPCPGWREDDGTRPEPVPEEGPDVSALAPIRAAEVRDERPAGCGEECADGHTQATRCRQKPAGGGEKAARLREELDRLRADYERACKTIAAMHAAAVGGARGPSRGVVEDVADLRRTAETFAALHRAAEETVTRIIDLTSQYPEQIPTALVREAIASTAKEK